MGRATPFSIEPVEAPPFAHRLVLPGKPHGCWLLLTYRTDPLARPLRPMVRLVRIGGGHEDFVLPGVALGLAHWLGRLPDDGFEDIRIAAEPGFVLERVGLRSDANLLTECVLKRPSRLLPALYTRLTGDERRFRNILRSACALTPFAGYAGWKAARLRSPEPDDPAASLSIRLIVPAGRGDADRLGETIASLTAQTHRAWQLVVLSEEGDEPEIADRSNFRIVLGRCAGEDGSILSGLARKIPPPSAGEGGLRVSEGRERGATLPERAVPSPLPPAPRAPSPAEGGGSMQLQSLLQECDALCILHPGDRLTPDALAILAGALAAPDAPDLVYADEEKTDSGPRLKPDWSPDLALVTGYTGHPTLLSRALLARIGDEAKDGITGLLPAAASAARAVVHIPRILCTAWAEPETDIRAAILDHHLARIGSLARAEVVGGVLDLHWPVPDPVPCASIVIPSRDRPDLIGRITQDVLTRTGYPAIELVIVDNGSTDRAVLDLYARLRADPRVRIVPFPYPFDFAAMVNAGAAAAHGAVLVFLNNDIAVTQPGWLAAMVGQAVRPEVGAVGAKLLYGDGRLQHAGVVIGIGGRSGHILRRRPGDTPGHLGRLNVAHEVSAVTAACLAVERRKFEAVGGFDQKKFPIDFNDADLCLRLAAKGWKTVWTPKASLLHLESVSRGPPAGQARARFEWEAEAFAERWLDVVRHDPYHHPAMTLTGFDEALE